jgi:hypothetical protein
MNAIDTNTLKITRTTHSMSHVAQTDIEQDMPVKIHEGYLFQISPTTLEDPNCIGQAATSVLAGQSCLVIPLNYLQE